MFSRSLTSAVVPLCSFSRTAGITAALDPVGSSLSGTISLFSFFVGITLLREVDEALLLGAAMATDRQELQQPGHTHQSGRMKILAVQLL